ncbi:SLAIN motif-containing protein-like isoform X2 [Corvus hawaiiensis]|uniref:SLAIN motif-containing protein-like isoform X4 n=1 Tax=Corvus moneduloides TaxID=1196302 RepID=UPI0013624A73|nr:SLAIN motif-containing protein-like isoform X4 [Corvus moneduloides]XP_048174714.1 SLAIN motif-containing protein-like isoform X2 [Corvus hawaiiensis]
MVVPGNAPLIQQDPALEPALGRDAPEHSAMGPGTEPEEDVGPEVRKLRELVRRLELDNQHARSRSSRSMLGTNVPGDIRAGVDNHEPGLNGMEINNSINAIADKQELQIMAGLHSQLSKMRQEEGENNCFKRALDAQVQYSCNSAPEEVSPDGGQGPGEGRCPSPVDPSDSSELLGSLLMAGMHAPAGIHEQNPSEKRAELEGLPSNADLDEVKVLELENCPEEEDCWLYVSPRKSMDEKTASPLKWCRQVLDNPSPEIEAACRTLINRLDQGYLSMHSALSSQSSVDSELSTSDDSISMGYKLQDLTDVQVMARLQEESLRQDCASSSASVSRRSSSASLHSLRRGTYSDQEFDTYSLEDEDDCDCSLSFRSAHRYSPSPLSSPRCQSPSAAADLGRASASRLRAPRRAVQSPMQERLKYANSEEELRHSMPNLARSSLRALEAVRSSRSLESDLQVPSSRIPRTQQRSAGLTPSKLRYSSGAGQSPLTGRQPGKAASGSSSLLSGRQVGKPCSYTAPVPGVRKPQLHTGSPSSSCTSRSTTMVTVAKGSALKARPAAGGVAAPKGKATPPSRRFLQAAQTPQAPEDDSWKDGCY